MKNIVINPKSDTEFKFITDLLNKLGVSNQAISQEEMEDLGLSKLMKGVDRRKKVSRHEIMKKLASE